MTPSPPTRPVNYKSGYKSINQSSTIEPSTDLDLSTDEQRVVKAQKLLNKVRDDHTNLDRDTPNDKSLRMIQNTLSETAVLLTIAEFDETDDIKDAVGRIERYLTAKSGSADDESLFVKRELAFRAIDSAVRTNPMHSL